MGRTKSVAEYDEAIARLKAKRQQAASKEAATARKRRNHAMMVYGGMLERACGGDWKRMDPAKVEAYCAKWASQMRKECCLPEGVETTTHDEANKAVRAHEKAMRERAAGKRADGRGGGQPREEKSIADSAGEAGRSIWDAFEG